MTKIEDAERTINIAIEALPFWHANADDKTLRMWVFKQIHDIEMPLDQKTLDYLENAYQWIKRGKPKPKIRVVK